MNVGSGGGSGDPDVMIDINTTPLIDVMLVLLVMLIITIPIQLHSVNLNMPTGNPPPPLVKPEVVKIDIDGAGAIYWNGEVVPDRADARGEAQGRGDAGSRSPSCTCARTRRRSTKSSPRVMASAQRLGLTKIGIVGSEQFIE